MNKPWTAVISLLLGSLGGCELQTGQDGNIMHFSMGNDGSQSVASISGRHSLVMINGDTLKISGGRLSLNGVSYGQVAEEDRVEYRVQDGRKILTVNGVPRNPLQHAG